MSFLSHYHSYHPHELACPECGGHVYEIRIRYSSAKLSRTSAWIFRSWSGERYLDGKPYTGPVYELGTGERRG